MAIYKSEYPILEYSTETTAFINPQREGEPYPRRCLLTFFQTELEKAVKEYDGHILDTYASEMKPFPVYGISYKGERLTLMQAVVGSGSIAIMTDYLLGKGVDTLLCCGSCGVLQDIPEGGVILPVRALRDEGGSYQYLPPSRFMNLDAAPISAAKAVLAENHISYAEATTWSTDGFFRETAEMVQYRKEEGCQVVEMECATMAAVARYRGKTFGQLLYSGDILADPEHYDDRSWYGNLSARARLFYLGLETLLKL